jgi:hypothetical protein
MTFRVSDPQVTSREDGTTELSASLAGERLWFRVPATWPVEMRGDPFAIASLIPAMLRGETLSIDPSLPVSRTLLTGMMELQHIYRLWGPVFRQKFTPIAIDATFDDPLPLLPEAHTPFSMHLSR